MKSKEHHCFLLCWILTLCVYLVLLSFTLVDTNFLKFCVSLLTKTIQGDPLSKISFSNKTQKTNHLGCASLPNLCIVCSQRLYFLNKEYLYLLSIFTCSKSATTSLIVVSGTIYVLARRIFKPDMKVLLACQATTKFVQKIAQC